MSGDTFKVLLVIFGVGTDIIDIIVQSIIGVGNLLLNFFGTEFGSFITSFIGVLVLIIARTGAYSYCKLLE